jgi:DNA-binding CsgD family transcriptional regulator
MEVKVSHFFIPENAVGEAEGLDYSQVEPLIRTAEALAQTIYQSVYIIDYLKQGFLYVSDNPLFLCGQTRQEVLDAGYEFYLKHVPKEELDMLREINTAGFRFFNEIPKEERLGVSISYDFHLMAGNRKFLINHKLTPLMLAKDGRVWLAVCVVSYSAQDKPGQIVVRKNNTKIFWHYSMCDHQWHQGECVSLSEEEKAILLLSAQGLKMEEIAERIFKSVDTVKFYKRRLFEKLGARNITEALSFATNYRLI